MKMLNAVWLTKTLMERGPLPFSAINQLWMKSGRSEGNSLPRSSFHRYRIEAEEFFEVDIECDRRYRYYVANPQVLSETRLEGWIYSRISDSMILMDSDPIRDRIMLESIPSAQLHLNELIHCMKRNKVIDIEYKKYDAVESQQSRVKPYFLKLYHQKWYLVAKNASDEYRTYSLDRIVDIEETDEQFTMPADATAAAYFKDSYGVVVDASVPVSQVVLRAYGTEPDYLRNLPLHHSQRELHRTDDYTDFEYHVSISWELMGKVLERGDRLEVISPESLRQQILRKLEETVKMYK